MDKERSNKEFKLLQYQPTYGEWESCYKKQGLEAEADFSAQQKKKKNT